MFIMFGIHRTDLHHHFSWLFISQLAFLLSLCGLGSASVVVYEDNTKVTEFADIELPYTPTVRKYGVEGFLVAANPLHACMNISKAPEMNMSLNWFVLISGNLCNFETKVNNAKLAGYSVAIIYTYRGRVENSNYQHGHYRFYSEMPAVVIKTEDGIKLKENFLYTVSILFRIVIFPNNSFSIMTFLLLFSIVAGLLLVAMLAFTIARFFEHSNVVSNGCLSSQHLRQLQTTTFKKDDLYETCAICLEDYKDQDKLRILPCSHGYHMECIDPWLTKNRRICPVCNQKVVLANESSNMAASNFQEEITPLLQEQRAGSHGTFSYVNPPANPNVSGGQIFVGNMQSTSGSTVPSDRQYSHSFPQI